MRNDIPFIMKYVVYWYLRFKTDKRLFEDDDRYETWLEEKARLNEGAYEWPEGLAMKSQVTLIDRDGMVVAKITKANCKNEGMLYLHGGAYIHQPVKEHWTFLDELAQLLGQEIYVPLYPKAPIHQVHEAYERLLSLYKDLETHYGADCLVMMGDSSGAGLALGLCQVIKEKLWLQPKKLVLIAPWLDVTMNNPACQHLAKKDPMLSLKGLKRAGKSWAGALDLKDPLVSPLYGDLIDLPPMMVIIGTHDLLYPDCERFKERIQSVKGTLDYRVYPKMLHVFPLLPVPQAHQAIQNIESFLC